MLRVDAQSHPDLFWAIRGGGGNFGVVTRFQFRLQEVDQVVGGLLVLPATAETVAGFIAAAEAAAEDMTTIANVMNCPPMPFLAAELHGSLVILAIMCWSGDVGEGERRDGAVPGAGRAARGHGAADAVPGRSIRRTTRTTTPPRWPGRCSSTRSTRTSRR